MFIVGYVDVSYSFVLLVIGCYILMFIVVYWLLVIYAYYDLLVTNYLCVLFVISCYLFCVAVLVISS